MEQHPTQGGDLQATPITNEPRQTAEQSATPTPEHQTHLTDDQLIHYHITEALREDRPIDHATARCIAAQLHGGQISALYTLASSGAVVDGLAGELESWRTDDTRVEVEPWLDALDEYLGDREDRSPIGGWSQLWPAQPAREENEPDDGEEERSPYGPPTSALGCTAVSTQVEHREAELQPGESSAVQRIREGMAAAQREGREIDHRTARDIARQFKQVPNGALAVFAGCGAILND
ncbi:MAG: hypothetical protein LC808_37075, partial [Actinobacteria bacterium]|nr:hypothetical protein [Actinomycetota bacterium]